MQFPISSFMRVLIPAAPIWLELLSKDESCPILSRPCRTRAVSIVTSDIRTETTFDFRLHYSTIYGTVKLVIMVFYQRPKRKTSFLLIFFFYYYSDRVFPIDACVADLPVISGFVSLDPFSRKTANLVDYFDNGTN